MEKEDIEMALDGDSDWKAPLKRPREIGDSDNHPAASKLNKTDPTLSSSTTTTTISFPFPDIDNPDSSYVSNILQFFEPLLFGYPYAAIPFPDLTSFIGFDLDVNTNEDVDMVEPPPPPPPPTSTSSYVKLPDDISLLRNLLAAQPPSPSASLSHSELILSAAALLVFHNAPPPPNRNRDLWNTIRANGFELFITVIIAASSLVFKLYSRAHLFRIASERAASKQMDTFWKDIQWMHKNEALQFYEVCKEVARLVADNHDKYSSITQPQLDAMTFYFSTAFCRGAKRQFDFDAYPLKYPSPARHHSAFEDKDGVLGQITYVLTSMELPLEKEDDEDRISWLRRLSRADDDMDDLVDKALHFVKLPDLDDNKRLHIRDMLESIIYHVKDTIEFSVIDVMQPLLALHRSASLDLHPKISNIVEVAEIRRMDLGDSFMGRSHLLWAFYELGYGFHAKVRDQIEIEVHADEDHPPYHIYLASLKLTRLLGETTTQLEHFIFAVIYSKSIGYDGEKIENFAKTFKDLRERHKFIEGERMSTSD